MRPLQKKLFRDLWHIRGQVLAIALVIASGVATFVMSMSTQDSLRLTQSSFYGDYRFADVFASFKRAPESVRARIDDIPGVQFAETRVVADVKLEVEGYGDPVTGRIVSVPENGLPLLNDIYLRAGRTVAPGRDNEVVVSEAFALAHGLRPGDALSAVINGRMKLLRIVGVGISPEYIYQLKPGSIIPDFERFAVLWMARPPLATAYDMEGAANDVVLSLLPGASPEHVIDRLDDLLAPYGGLGAYEREDQLSHRYLSEEFKQLTRMATLYPIIFLAVAAFLLNVVIGRLVNTEREQVAALKAFGYRNLDIAVHYLKFVLLIVFLGDAAGVGVGILLGRELSEIYTDYYRFPFLTYIVMPRVVLWAALVSSAAAVLGTVMAVTRAALLPPAQAMRPEPPASYRVTFIERIGLGRLLSPPTRMIARHIERGSLKSLLSITGIAMAGAILMVGNIFGDAVDRMIAVQYGLAERGDLMVSFTEPTSQRALSTLLSLPGVTRAEGFRSVPARLRHGHRSYRTAVFGLDSGGDLYRILDDDFQPLSPPTEGIMLTDHLAEKLAIRPGETLTVEVLEGSRPVRHVPVAALVSQYIGVAGYMDRAALNRLMKEGSALSGAHLAADPRLMPSIFDRLHRMPRVAGTEVRLQAIRNFRETMSGQVLIFAAIATILAATIAVGVVYNSARIALSERGRELASLRVLGFTRAEVAYILLGEIWALTLAAIPVGFVIGYGLCLYIVTQLPTDLFRLPLVVEPATYAFSATVILVSTLLSGFVVKYQLDRLDLVAVLKTKE